MTVPHPYPTGWYRFRYSHELRAGQAIGGRFFGRELVGWRDAAGRPHVMDAHCRHLGAHLGDGTVRGDTLQCPFHGWRYGGDGRCRVVPFVDTVPEGAAVTSHPVVERSGVVWFWHDLDGAAPWFEVPDLPECSAPTWRRRSGHRRVIRSRIQDPRENAVDTAHTPFVHRRSFPVLPGTTPAIEDWRESDGGTRLDFTIVSTVGRPSRPRTIRVAFTMVGPGFASMAALDPADLLFVVPLTPVDEQRLVFTMQSWVRRSRVPFLNDLLGLLGFRYFLRGLLEDYPIFERKTYLTEPLLTEADGPVAELRRWLARFEPGCR